MAEYALLDRDGEATDGGVLASGTSRLSQRDFLVRFDQYPHRVSSPRREDPNKAANPINDANFYLSAPLGSGLPVLVPAAGK